MIEQYPSRWAAGVGVCRWLVFVLAASLLAACGAMQSFKQGNQYLEEGKVAEGLAKLEEAVRLDPKNLEYRMGLASRRAGVVNQLLAGAEAHRRAGRLSEAEKGFRQALVFDPENVQAHQEQRAIVAERKHHALVTEAESIFKRGKADDLALALEKLRPVLQENPKQREALNLKERIDTERAKERRAEARLAATYRQPITLEFRDAPLKSVFDVIARLSGLNFFFDKDLRPDLKASILAKNTTVEDAVRLLLVTNQLEQKILNENSVLIYPNTPQKQKEYQSLSIRSFFLANADVKAVSNTIKTLVKTKDLVIDERLGLLIMRDTPEAIRLAERIVALQDLSDPEVMLEVEILEIKRSRLLELGISWPGQLTFSPIVPAESVLSVASLRGINSSAIQVTGASLGVNARKEDQEGNILANPRIRVRNKEKAKVLIGEKVPVITTTSNANFVSESVTYVDVGLKLEVEPSIYLDEEVAIKINLEVSSLVREVLSKSGTLSYQIGTRGASTVLRLKDGETQILAGLISDEERSSASKVPGVGELPLVGRLFGNRKDDSQRSEILLSITPRVVRSIRRPDLLAAEFESGTEASIGAMSLRLAAVDTSVSAAVTGAVSAPTGGARAAVATARVPAGISSTGPGSTPAESVPSQALPSSLTLNWAAPPQVKVGEQFSAVLRVNSQASLRGLPLLVGFDPQLFQVVSVIEGDYFRQAGGRSSFSQRVDPAQGKIFVAAVRQAFSGTDSGINGTGSVVTVTLKAIRPAAQARIQLLSATPEPPLASTVPVPMDHVIRVVP
ncbi:MAG: cohesin domain-containing protein [Ramlibacter sp.]|nr:cohesin domain-containing protein [Ramlibacter sp.]